MRGKDIGIKPPNNRTQQTALGAAELGRNVFCNSQAANIRCPERSRWPTAAESSSVIKKRVAKARNMQLQRFKNLKKKIFANGQMKNAEIKKFCPLDGEGDRLLQLAVDKFDLSARGYFKVLKIARTIADLEGVEKIEARHVQEALQYRSLDLSRF